MRERVSLFLRHLQPLPERVDRLTQLVGPCLQVSSFLFQLERVRVGGREWGRIEGKEGERRGREHLESEGTVLLIANLCMELIESAHVLHCQAKLIYVPLCH